MAVKPKPAKLKPVRSIRELQNLSEKDKDYEALALRASENLGGSSTNLTEAIRWLETNAMEAGEDGVIDEINDLR